MSAGTGGRRPDADDELRRLFRSTADDLTHGVVRPPVREVIHRARARRGTASEGRPAPLAAVLALAAAPVAVGGAVLIGPAVAGVIGGGPAEPMEQAPSGVVASVEAPAPAPVPASPVTGTEVAASGGASAVTPLREVTVFFSDRLLVEDGCRRLTSTTRLVPSGDPVGGALRALFEGPRPEERAAGLVDQFSSDPADGPQAPTSVQVGTTGFAAVVDVPDAAWTGTTPVECRQDELGLALERTIEQFDGWTVALHVGGSAEAGAAFLAADPTTPEALAEPEPDPMDVLDDPSLPPSDAAPSEPAPSS